MFKFLVLFSLIAFTVGFSKTCNGAYYHFPDQKTEPVGSQNCADLEYCVCINGTINNKPFSATDCQNTMTNVLHGAFDNPTYKYSDPISFDCSVSLIIF